MYFSRIKEIETELSNISERKKVLETELSELKEKQEKETDLPRVEKGFYSHIKISEVDTYIAQKTDDLDMIDDYLYYGNNYFPEQYEDFALDIIDKFKFILFLARQKMIYCPDYKPDWNDSESKWFVYFDHKCNKFCVGIFNYCETKEIVYFPTAEIAQKVCDKLNEQLRNKEGE